MTQEETNDTNADTDSVETVAETTPEPTNANPTPEPTPTDALKSQAEEYLAGWQRTRAEFANYKKRIEREMFESRNNGALNALGKLLPIVDDFERAVQNIPADLTDNAWIKGTQLLLPKLQKLLAEFDIELHDPAGEPFDPNKHQAIGMDDDGDVPSGHVTVTLQKGYISGERVLRPALVKVKS